MSKKQSDSVFTRTVPFYLRGRRYTVTIEQVQPLPKLHVPTGNEKLGPPGTNLRAMADGVSLLPHPNPILGKGLFAERDFKAGELLWLWNDAHWNDSKRAEEILISWDDYDALEESNIELYRRAETYGYQTDEFHLCVPPNDPGEDASNFMNHSCDPNCWWEGEDIMLARRDIKKGEEITFDYATCDSAWDCLPKCACDAGEKCRGTVRADDWMLESIQEAYGHHFVPYFWPKLGYVSRKEYKKLSKKDKLQNKGDKSKKKDKYKKNNNKKKKNKKNSKKNKK